MSFVRDHNLWLFRRAGGKERAFTTGGTEKLRKGELDWVYPEELDINTAYWWAPDSSAVAYLEMNESKVSQFPLVNFESYTGEAELQRYPVPSGSNPCDPRSRCACCGRRAARDGHRHEHGYLHPTRELAS